jgi:predicted GIY-YIG superfamily endonuclease
MSLHLTHEYLLDRHIIEHKHVIAHMKSVLNVFASKPEYKRFYIGITSDIESRRLDHQRNKPEFSLMCSIYTDEQNIVANSFHNLELEAITALRGGILHPDTRLLLLKCENGPGGSMAKNWIYILVG